MTMAMNTVRTTECTNTKLEATTTKKELEIGPAKGALTTISVSAKCAICATLATLKATKCCTNNKQTASW